MRVVIGGVIKRFIVTLAEIARLRRETANDNNPRKDDPA
jgi:hypothetical protein